MITTVNLAFSVSGQTITAEQTCPYLLASNTVNYVKVHFTLDEEWAGVQTVSAVWSGASGCICTLLDSNGDCFVPQELLAKRQKVYVNLSGSDTENNEVIDRLTTYPLYVINVNATAYTNGSETVPVTPSQFEQFIQQVIDLVGTVKDIDRIEITDDYYLVVYYSDGTQSYPLGPVRGPQGEQGPQGEEGPQGETGNGISSITLYSTSGAVKTYRITFTDGTHFDFQVTDGEVTRAELASVLPTDTASGSIASFPDGSDLFDYLSCVVNIEPVQDLHGYDKPWVGGAGKNKVNCADISAPSTANTEYTATLGSASYVISFDIVNAVRTNLANTSFVDVVSSGENNYITGETILKVSDNSTLNSAGANINGRYYCKFNGAIDSLVFLWRSNSYATLSSGAVKNIMVEVGNSATTFEPYENLCPITGWTGCEVSQTGFNLWGGEKLADDIVSAVPQATKDTVNKTVECFPIYWAGKRLSTAKFKENTRYTFILKFSNTVARTNIQFAYTDGTTELLITSNTGLQTIAYTSANGKTLSYIRGGNNDGKTIIYYEESGIFEGVVTVSDFSPYNGTTYNITWQTEAGTVYGGTVDLVTGVLTDKMAGVEYDGDEAWSWANNRAVIALQNAPTGSYSRGLISNYLTPSVATTSSPSPWEAIINSSGTLLIGTESINSLEEWETYLSTNPLQVVYNLATPSTYQLDPVQITCLLGQNNVWADCGDIEEVKYKADVQRYIAKVTA